MVSNFCTKRISMGILATTYIELGDYETAEKWVIKGLNLAKKSKDSDVAAVKKEMQDTYDYIQKVK